MKKRLRKRVLLRARGYEELSDSNNNSEKLFERYIKGIEYVTTYLDYQRVTREEMPGVPPILSVKSDLSRIERKLGLPNYFRYRVSS